MLSTSAVDRRRGAAGMAGILAWRGRPLVCCTEAQNDVRLKEQASPEPEDSVS